ncbi:MAG: prevent-host-death protein [Okeania sp. SIO3I5]|uniref:prevent-host-death protein n=1 Tax=Okeania sp. SIO3I5 TaxID=2607805 RepID=UPI0013B7C32A|nr:prevent-host-death protein [Okeania sp. SIO3I5]NEQ35002.1 prevent-host-death protein [Okeania sp. SIO3I5]
MNWEIHEAQQNLSDLIKATNQKPQMIYEQEKLVAAIISPQTFQEFLAWQKQRQKPSLADTFAELRSLCTEEDYVLEIPTRQNRPNPFSDDFENVSI